MMEHMLIATKEGLLLWDGNFRTVHEGWGKYTGITWDEEKVFVVARGAPGGEGILVLDAALEPVDVLYIPRLKGTNYIGWFDGKLWVTNTGRDRVEIWDGEKVETWNWTGQDSDVNHINSIWHDGEHVWVTEGGRSGNRARAFTARARRLVRTVEDLGKTIHNIYREGNWLYTVSSMSDAVSIRNLETGEHREVSYAPYHRGYGEGLARLPWGWMIGVSRDSPEQSAILSFDDGWRFLDKLLLPDDIGQLYEFRPRTGEDRAHNGIPFPAGRRRRKRGKRHPS